MSSRDRLPLPVPAALAPHVDRLETFQRDVALDRFLVSTGQKATTDLSPFVRHADLADGRLIRDLLEAGAGAWARELVRPYFRARLREATDRLRAAQRGATVELGGRRLGQAAVLAAWRGATGPAARRAAGAAADELAGLLAGEQERWLDAYAATRKRLGFATHRDFVRAVHPELDAWVEHAAGWLAATREDYLAAWRDWAHRDGLVDPRPLDTRLVGGAAAVPAGVPPALEAGRSTVARWGLGPALASVEIDAESRPGKVPLAFCAGIAPPSDVRVSVHRSDALADYRMVVHELTHALHFTVGPTRPSDLWPVHPAVTEALGLAVEQVAAEPSWYEAVLGCELGEEALARLRFDAAAAHRLVAASLIYELAVHDGSVSPAAEYVRVVGHELGVRASPAQAHGRLQSYLEGHPCYPLVYYQAFTIRQRIWDLLVGAGGPCWHLGAAATGRLRALFETAPAITWPEELGG
jgi:hypothetical protein